MQSDRERLNDLRKRFRLALERTRLPETPHSRRDEDMSKRRDELLQGLKKAKGDKCKDSR